jgi:hypothetical protein
MNLSQCEEDLRLDYSYLVQYDADYRLDLSHLSQKERGLEVLLKLP